MTGIECCVLLMNQVKGMNLGESYHTPQDHICVTPLVCA